MTEPPQLLPHQQDMHRTEDGTAMSVLNASSHLTLQRTIVEAFVKLVVCRKVTVQKVLATNGHVLDSHTTQEEDLPVILDVHRQEVKDICSAFSSNQRSQKNPDSDSSDPCSQSSMVQDINTANRHDREFSSDNDGRPGCSAEDFQKQRCVDDDYQTPGKLSVLSKVLSNNSCFQSPLKPLVTDTQERETNQEKDKGKSVQFENEVPRKKIKLLTVGDANVNMDQGFAPDTQLFVGSERGHIGLPRKLQDFSGSARRDERDDASQGSVYESERTIKSEEYKAHEETAGIQQGETLPSSNESQTELKEGAINDTSDIGLRESNLSAPLKLENVDYGDTTTTAAKVITDSDSLAVQKMQLDTEDKNSVVSGQEQSFATRETGDREKVLLNSETNEKKLETDKQGSVGKTPATSCTSEVENKAVADRETEHDKKSEPEVQEICSELVEDDSEQDILVIDISNTELERPSHTEDGSDCMNPVSVEHRQQGAEKRSHFLHKQTSFACPDKSSDCAPQRNEVQQATNKIAMRDSPKETATTPANAKQVQDDDCMITAAFIKLNPMRKRRVQSSRPLERTASAEVAKVRMTAGSGHSQKGSVYETTSQGHGLGQRGGYRSPALQQFEQPGVGLQSNNSAAITYITMSHSHMEQQPVSQLTTAPSTSQPQAYLPNFLASSPLSIEEGMFQSGPMPLAQGTSTIDYSQETHQCTLCSKIFLHRPKFERHMLICGGHRPFKCKICGKGFNQRAHLDTHMKFHMGIKRYRCDMCRKAYVMKGDLIRHLNTQAHKIIMQSHNPPVP